MNCRYAIDKQLKDQYSKGIWKSFKHKPACTYCILSNSVCNAKYKNGVFRCDNE